MKLKGYIFSRPFFGERLPQHIQNLVLRDYCKKNNINFLLSGTEYTVEGSTYILEELVNNWKNYDGLIFYSLFQLPKDFKKRAKLYQKTLKAKKQLHFVLENIVGKDKNTFLEIEEIFKIKSSNYSTQKKVFKIGKLQNFVTRNHQKTKRNYLSRMKDEKIKCMKISKKYGFDYWDGNRRYGYGGYKYIPGYHAKLAKKLIKTYKLNANSKILDLGCGKGFLLYEIKKILKNITVVGLDFSKYAKKNAKTEIKNNITTFDLNKKLRFKNNEFDLVISINTLHNLKLKNLIQCLSEIDRVGVKKYICTESYRNEREQFNVQCWALTAETLIDVNSWKYVFELSGYSGDFEFIYFE